MRQDARQPPENKMECIYEPRHGFEAQLLKDLLAQEGIESEVHGADLQGAVGNLPALGLVQLRVAPEQAAAARDLMRRWAAGELALPDDDADDAPKQRPARRPPAKPEQALAWLLLLGLLGFLVTKLLA
jgi:Putative prokaryotic signal transducing protein